jgi:Ca-activated chloride channel family protein
MKAHARLDRNVVAVNVDGTVHLLVELHAPSAPRVDRAPIDVIATIDGSGSMDGGKLHAVIAAVVQLGRLLSPEDRLGVVVFDTDVRMVLPLGSYDAAELTRALGSVTAQGYTNLSGGWLMAREHMAEAGRPEALRRIIVLTDGEANQGIKDPDQLVDMVKVGTTGGSTISTSVIGFGDGFNEDLCAAMADSGGGNDYFCSGPDHAPQVFQQEFQGLESVVAQNISVEIRGTDEVVATGLLDEYRVDQVDDGLRIVVGDAYGDEKRSVIARLVLRRVELAGPVKVADVVVRWANVVGDLALHSTTIPVVVGVEEGVDPDRIPVDQDIVERVDVLNIARARREAGDLADRGDTDAALKRLEDAIRIAANRPSMKSTLDDVERDRSVIEEGRWTTGHTKSVKSKGRSTTKGRKRDFTDDSWGTGTN